MAYGFQAFGFFMLILTLTYNDLLSYAPTSRFLGSSRIPTPSKVGEDMLVPFNPHSMIRINLTEPTKPAKPKVIVNNVIMLVSCIFATMIIGLYSAPFVGYKIPKTLDALMWLTVAEMTISVCVIFDLKNALYHYILQAHYANVLMYLGISADLDTLKVSAARIPGHPSLKLLTLGLHILILTLQVAFRNEMEEFPGLSTIVTVCLVVTHALKAYGYLRLLWEGNDYKNNWLYAYSALMSVAFPPLS
jgi:hypothetical protein